MPQSAGGAEAENLVALNRRIYGKAEGDGELLNGVLYRDKLAKTFNSRGYAKFRNLAKISRPKKKKRRDGGEKRAMKGVGKNEVALVEVVEDEDEESDGDDLSRLLGEDVARRPKWRGSTRLLLLDEHYANKRIEELPEAIKVYILMLGTFGFCFKECQFVESSVDSNTCAHLPCCYFNL